MKNWPLVVVAALLAAAAPSCYSPETVGSGDVSTPHIAFGYETGIVHVSPDEQLVIVETKSDTQTKLLYDGDMSPLKPTRKDWKAFSFGSTGDRGAILTPLELQKISVPGMSVKLRVEKPKTGLVSRSSLLARPGGGWVAVASDRGVNNIWPVSGEPFRFVGSGRSGIAGEIRGRAVDDATGLLLLTDGGNHLEFYDLDAMKTVATIELPCREVSFGLAAKGGRAWVGTRDGMLVPVDVGKRTAGAPILLGSNGVVDVAVSVSGALVAVTVQDRSSPSPPYFTTMKVFRQEGDGLKEVASTSLHARGEVRGVAAIDLTRSVVVSTGEDLLKWKFEGKK